MAGAFDAIQRTFNGGDYYDRKSKELNERFIDDLNKMADDENYVYADINVYTKTTYCSKDKIRRKDDIFRMKLQRAIGVQDDCNASIHNIGCRSCGASFDAVREKKCPYCGNAYDLKQDRLKYILSAALTMLVTVSLMLQNVLIVNAEPKTGVSGSHVAYDQSNPSYHYFYKQLSREAQRFYQAMEEMYWDGYFANGEEYDLSANGKMTDLQIKSLVSGDSEIMDECSAAIYAFHEDYPDVFYVDFAKFSVRTALERDGTWHGYLSAGLLRTFTKQNIPQAVERYEKAIEDALKDLPTKATGNKTLAEIQTCYIHDYLIKNMVYHHENEVSNANCNARTAYDALVYGEGVCEAYTRGFKALMDRAGIPTVCVSGIYSSASEGNENHIWNYVQINGKWYGVDATHDDPTVKGSDKKNSKRETRRFCLVGAQDFAQNRIPDGSFSEINYEFKYPRLEQKNLRKKSILSWLNEGLAMPASLIIAGYVVFVRVRKDKVLRRAEIEQR